MKQIFYTYILCFLALNSSAQIYIQDGDLQGDQTYTWTSDNEYFLDGSVFLEDGGVLNIEAGTVIKGMETPTTGDNASALIIARGAQIFANGTADEPIIFTAEVDDVNDNTELFPTDRGFWGGLIILGNAHIADDACPQSIEGLPVGDPRSLYGDCANPQEGESSGVIRYVSIRHGGAEIGDGNEINGLTLGAVGSGTIIENVEVFANLDDGIEWFGGTASVKYAAVSFCGDDAMDYDTGWRGKGQFWFVLVGDDAGDNGGEHDGAIPDDNTPFSSPTIYNATYIGAGNKKALTMRDATGGIYANSIFTKFKNGVEIEEEPTKPIDSWERMQNGELSLLNNVWWDFAAGNNFAAGEIIKISSTATDDTNGDVLRNHLIDNGNDAKDPGIRSISYTDDDGLNPTPANNDVVYTNLANYPSDDFFTKAKFKGAFCDDGVWMNGWTALSAYGILDSAIPTVGKECDVVTSAEEIILEENGYKLAQNNPNPANGLTNITFELPKPTTISLTVYNMQGQAINTIIDNAQMTTGEYTVAFDTCDLDSGIYFYTLQNAEVVITKQMIVQ